MPKTHKKVAKSSLFKDVTVRLGEIRSKAKKVKIEWFYNTFQKRDIATYLDKGALKYAIKKGCGCTADIEVKDDRIVAYYNDSGRKAKGTAIAHHITVYTLLGTTKVPVQVVNAKGVKTFNPQLKKQVLYFRGTIQ